MCPTYNVHCHRPSDGCCVISAPLQSPQTLNLHYCQAVCMCLIWFPPPPKYKVLSAGRPILHLCFLHWKCFDAGWILRLHQDTDAGAAWMIEKKSWCLWAKVWRWFIGWVHDGVTEGRRRCEMSRGSAAFTPPAARSPSPHILLEQPGLHRLLPARARRSFAFLSMRSLDSRSSSSWQWGSFANILWFTPIASEIPLFFQASAFWTNSGGKAKQSVGTLRRESSSSFCVGLHAPPLLLCLWAFRPTSAHVNLDKYRVLDCSVSSLRSLSFTSLRGEDESLAPWETVSPFLLQMNRLHAPYLSLLTPSEAERARCSEPTSTDQSCLAPTLPATGPPSNHLFRSFYAHQCELVSV